MWATWSTTDEVVCLALYECGRRRQGRRPCSLFGAHPGPCSYDRDDALVEDPARAARINTALAVLAQTDQHDRAVVQSAAHDAALLTWDELRARQIWTDLPAYDQVAMYRLLARADSLRATPQSAARTARVVADNLARMTRLWDSSLPKRLPHGERAVALLDALDRLPPPWRIVVLGAQRERRYEARMPLDDAVPWAVSRSSEGQPVPTIENGWKAEWDRKEDERCGETIGQQLTKLPYGWQVDTVREVVLGADALGAVSNAACSINVISGYGVPRA